MKTFVYRCPTTGLRVQGWVPDDYKAEEAVDVYENVTCLACSAVHFVNPKTGNIMGKAPE
jgi:hypothetical protein